MARKQLQGTLMVVAMAIVASIFFLLLDQIFKFFLDIVIKLVGHFNEKLVHSSITFKL